MTKLLICGSAAAEAVPGVFCTCPLCLKALEEGGKDIRSRTAYQLGESIRIDLGPDLFYHMVKFGLRLDKLRELVITHNHRDHFYPDELANRRQGMSKVPEGAVLRVIGSPIVVEQVKNTTDPEKSLLKFESVEHGSKVMLHGDVELTAFQANHGAPESLFYAFRTKEYSLLIANDTGWFPDQSWDLLKNFAFDAVILDCCYMHWDQRHGHMGGDSFIACLEELRKQGSLKENALLVANHFSHNPNLSHEELCSWLTPRGIEVGFDGMEIEL
ncbi:MAG: hypothetical protein IKD44_08130 [Lentisphaeria bacterium]|nr:hypothetical protein [Lentisphaeria bacterium]